MKILEDCPQLPHSFVGNYCRVSCRLADFRENFYGGLVRNFPEKFLNRDSAGTFVNNYLLCRKPVS